MNPNAVNPEKDAITAGLLNNGSIIKKRITKRTQLKQREAMQAPYAARTKFWR